MAKRRKNEDLFQFLCEYVHRIQRDQAWMDEEDARTAGMTDREKIAYRRERRLAEEGIPLDP